MLLRISIYFLLLLANTCLSQNLVPNADFESEIPNPEENGLSVNYFTCTDWESPNTGTPDFFTTKRSWNAQQLFAKPKPFSGQSFVGLVFFPDSTDSKGGSCEYLQCRLKEKLLPNAYYCLSIHLRPAEEKGYSLNEIDFLATPEKLVSTDDFIKSDSYNKIVANKRVFEPKAWNKISGCYSAKGGEEYLTIGLFNQRCKRVSLSYPPKPFRGFYFFIDLVSLVPIKDTAKCGCNKLVVIRDSPGSFSLALNKPLVLQNIQFETGKATLIAGSEKELNELADYLLKNPAYNIKISGHTDNVGKESDNLILSKARAETVANYLVSKGVNKSRISSNGLGSSAPLKPNDNEENKKINRRVEFSLSK